MMSQIKVTHIEVKTSPNTKREYKLVKADGLNKQASVWFDNPAYDDIQVGNTLNVELEEKGQYLNITKATLVKSEPVQTNKDEVITRLACIKAICELRAGTQAGIPMIIAEADMLVKYATGQIKNPEEKPKEGK